MGRLRSGADNAALFIKVKSTIKGRFWCFIGWRVDGTIKGRF